MVSIESNVYKVYSILSWDKPYCVSSYKINLIKLKLIKIKLIYDAFPQVIGKSIH